MTSNKLSSSHMEHDHWLDSFPLSDLKPKTIVSSGNEDENWVNHSGLTWTFYFIKQF